MIHVCLSLYDKNGTYSKFTGTTMLSIFENTSSPVTIHILHDKTLTQDNREKFIYIAGRYSQAVKFYNVDELCAEKLSKLVALVPAVKNSRVSVGAFYRILIPQLLSDDIEKIIYLDSDIVVNLDINELWKIDLDKKVLAAAPEAVINYLDHDFHSKTKFLIANGFVKPEDYFNSGVMLMSLNYLRNAEDTIMNGVKWRGEHTQCDCFDQDILNYLFSKDYLKLDEKFDVFVSIDRRRGYNSIRKAIYHYGGRTCTLDMSDPFNALWMKYFVKTPWFNEKIIARLYEKFFQAQAEIKKSAMNLFSAAGGKPRVFIVDKTELDGLKENFSIREDEEIFAVDGTISFWNLVAGMKSLRGQKIFFFLLGGFPFNKLEKAGFVRGKDFVDGFDFSPNFNSYQFINAM